MPKKANRDPEDGKPITGPNNFGIRKPRHGKTEDVYFSRGTYNAIGDPFKQAANAMMGGRAPLNREVALKAGHEVDFKPARMVKEKLYK